MIYYSILELELILEEVAKLPKTADTSYVPPDVLNLVDERFWECGRIKK